MENSYVIIKQKKLEYNGIHKKEQTFFIFEFVIPFRGRILKYCNGLLSTLTVLDRGIDYL